VVLLTNLRRTFFGFEDEPAIVMAKIRALKHQIPLLYVILLLNVAFVALTQRSDAPVFLTTIAPAALAIACIMRGWGWFRLNVESLTMDAARARLKSTIAMVSVLGVVLTVWSTSLTFYSDPHELAQIAIFMALTSAACMMCLLHLRAAALQLAVIVIVPFTTVFLMSPMLAHRNMAVNVALAIATMVFVVISQNRSFIAMVRQQGELMRKQEESERLSAENARLATRDALTGLANRRSFITSFADTLRLSKRHGTPVALVLLDLDGFKAVNDVYGHSAGDTLLVKAGSRLRDAMAEQSYCARLSGDEFAICMTGFANEADLLKQAGHIASILAQPFSISQVEVMVSTAVGISIFGHPAQSAQDMFEFADFALYHSKESNDSSPVIFDAMLERKISLLHELEHVFRTGRLEQELSLAYQPMLSAGNREIVAYEALARWQNDRLGHLTAAEFIEAAGRCGMADRLTQVLFRQLLAELPRLPEHLTVSFNLSARDLINPQAVLGIVSQIQKSDTLANRLQFEVSESAVATDFEKVMKSLGLLRNLGCSISLNNFGSTQSVLGYIYRLPIDTVKVDSSFVNQCETVVGARETLRAIIELCNRLDLASVAVGIETESQARMAEDLGCTTLQGFYFARPETLDAIAPLRGQKTVASAT
jgi:diguanylate cyclase (GGDEF)-like protein